MQFPPLRLSYLTWGLAATFYLYGFFQRVTPASLAGDLMRDFGLTAAGLGNLAAFYYYAYAAMQIPTGVMVDRWGPSRLFLAGSVLAGLGALLFGLAQSVLVAGLGRALIGAAHGMAWVSMLKLAAHWFPQSRFGTISGLSLAVGTLGAVLAGPPLRWLADAFGWRSVIAASGTLALLLAVAIWRQSVLDVFHYRNTWLLFVVNSGICGCFLAFTGLWGVPFFVQHHALSVPQAALVTSMMLVLFATGGPIMGSLSDRWQLRKRPFALGAGVTVAGFCTLAAWPAAPLPLLVAALAAASLGAGAMAISFGYAKESVPLPLQGTVTGVVNAGVMVGTLTQMPVIGLILDAHWQGVAINGVRQYSLEAFQVALMLLAGWMVVSFALLLATRETHAKQFT